MQAKLPSGSLDIFRAVVEYFGILTCLWNYTSYDIFNAISSTTQMI